MPGIDGLELAAVSAANIDKHRPWLDKLGKVPAALPIEALADAADIVIECAPSKLVRSIVSPVVSRGKTADRAQRRRAPGERGPDRTWRGSPWRPDRGADRRADRARRHDGGGRRYHSFRAAWSPASPSADWPDAPYLVENNIDIEKTHRAAEDFRRHRARSGQGVSGQSQRRRRLSLAGIGADRTRVEIWADPTVTRNTHRIEVESDSARFSMGIENIPSENPKTGQITALSVIACLRKLRAPLRIGT